MPDTYQADGAADPEAYARLMQERYGPLTALCAERDLPGPPQPTKPGPRRHSTRWPDPNAAFHRELLLLALDSHRQRTTPK
ncbi:hypothetical protein F4556_004985 [Kitasatospora gansuensis]|uniref:Uncharacterized protein n=1 Tax=Kitasatospora gansuensis TaxID=258050 RepID=A0A7W7SFD6_9ACTN|nr:hypothetical protein [Kitasatospora gansuensis]